MYNVWLHIYSSKSIDQPGKVANPARGQLNRENIFSPVRVRGCSTTVSCPLPPKPAGFGE